jgi:hypothetical protein
MPTTSSILAAIKNGENLLKATTQTFSSPLPHDMLYALSLVTILLKSFWPTFVQSQELYTHGS